MKGETLNTKIKNMKKILLILLLAPLSIWGQVSNDSVALANTLSINLLTGENYSFKTTANGFVSIYQAVGSSPNGITKVNQGNNGTYQKDLYVIQLEKRTYPKATFDALIPNFEATDPLLISYNNEIAQRQLLFNDRMAIINKLKALSGIIVPDTISQVKIDSLERFIATDLVKMRDTMRIINAKFAAMELKEKLRDSTLIVAGGATVLTLNSARNILVRNVGAISTITLPSPIGHKEEFVIKRDLGSIGRVDVTCATASIVANQATTTAVTTVQLATRPLYGHTMRLRSNGITWQLQ
jgi:hypothetical protein